MTAIDPYLPAGLTLQSLLAYLIGGLTFLSVVAVWRTFVEERPKIVRTRAVARNRLGQEGAGKRLWKRRLLNRQDTLGVIVIRRLRLLQTSEAERIRGGLFRAGLRSREAMGGYLRACFIMPVLDVAV
jgi:hypothetical protein